MEEYLLWDTEHTETISAQEVSKYLGEFQKQTFYLPALL